MIRQTSLRIIIVYLLCNMMVSAMALHKKALVMRPSADQVDSVLRILDDVIAHKTVCQARRIASADSMVRIASMKDSRNRIEAFNETYDFYSHVSGKRSMAILDSLSRCAEYVTDRGLRLWFLTAEPIR